MPAAHRIDEVADSLMGARKLRVITPAASGSMPDGVCDSLIICDSGAVAVEILAEDDTASVVVSITGPIELRIRAREIKAAGTTATKIVATY